jgi:histidine triad (HIT) family protein
MQPPCIFCQIVNRETGSSIVYSDERVTAVRDIRPVAAAHVLILPNRHVQSLNDLQDEDEALIGYMFSVARKLAVKEGIDQTGYRIVINTGDDGGQTVYHLHVHLIGGRRMHWPPG